MAKPTIEQPRAHIYNYVLEGFEEQQEQHLAIAHALLMSVEPKDQKNPADDTNLHAWRLAQVLDYMLSSTVQMKIASSALLGEKQPC